MQVQQERDIDGFKFTVQQLTAMKSLRMLNRLGRIVGPALGKAGGAAQGGFENLNVKDLGDAVGTLFERLSDDELESITRELLSGATVTMSNGQNGLLMPQFDLVLQGRPETILKLLKFALEVNYQNFFRGFAGLGLGNLANPLRSISPTPSKTIGQSGDLSLSGSQA